MMIILEIFESDRFENKFYFEISSQFLDKIDLSANLGKSRLNRSFQSRTVRSSAIELVPQRSRTNLLDSVSRTFRNEDTT
jgi:hypothetical protein